MKTSFFALLMSLFVLVSLFPARAMAADLDDGVMDLPEQLVIPFQPDETQIETDIDQRPVTEDSAVEELPIDDLTIEDSQIEDPVITEPSDVDTAALPAEGVLDHEQESESVTVDDTSDEDTDPASSAASEAADAEENGTLNQKSFADVPAVSAELGFAVPDSEGLGVQELMTAYAQRELDLLSHRGRPMLKAARNLGDSLTGPNAVLYRENKAQIARVAAGELNSTRIAVDTAALLGKTSFSAEDLGMDIVVSGRINPDAIYYIQNQINAALVVRILTQDCPYELYWFDKTRGFSYGFVGSYTVDGSGELHVPPSYVISYYVSGDCAPEHTAGGFVTDPTVGWQVQSAVSNIRGIVADAEGLDDRSKLNRYKQEICDRVSYNYSAAGGGYSYNYGNPWQLIWVFDNDSSTNVVCEGYSKAFQYLCDLSSFKAVICYSVHGDMAVDGRSGGHMWNIIRMPDGKNYIADITNCDSGSIGSPDLLFLKVFSATAGSFAGKDLVYSFNCGYSTVEYSYDPEMYGLFSENDLTLYDGQHGSPAPKADGLYLENGFVTKYLNGKIDTAYTGLANYEDTWYYLTNGVQDNDFFGFTEFAGGKFLVANGSVATHINGLFQDPNDTAVWYFLSNGQAQTQYSGLALYDGAWFYLKDGILDTTFSGVVDYDGGKFLVGAGRIMSEVSGLCQDPITGTWYFFADGMVQDYTGEVEYGGATFHITHGVLDA